VDPGEPIPVDASEVHGIVDVDVQDCPPFAEEAYSIYAFLHGADLMGYNHVAFDVPLLWEEFYRCGIKWDLDGVRYLDAGTLYKKRESRTLTDAVRFYLNREFIDAHDAIADVRETVGVWRAQCELYGLNVNDREELHTESNWERQNVDLAGKIIVGPDGRPTYNIGKAKGTAVEDDKGFGRWMLDKDFTENTKMHLRKILKINERHKTANPV